MKRLDQMKLLQGQHETITMSELRARPGEVLDQIQQGKSFTITRVGKVMAEMIPPELNAIELGAEVRRLGLHNPNHHH